MDFGTDCFHTVLDFIFATAGEQKKKKQTEGPCLKHLLKKSRIKIKHIGSLILNVLKTLALSQTKVTRITWPIQQSSSYSKNSNLSLNTNYYDHQN